MIENQTNLEIDYKVKASELEAKLAEKQVQELQEAQKNKAIVEASAKNLPIELAKEFCIGRSNEETINKISLFADAFEKEVSKRVNSIISQRFGDAGREVSKPGEAKPLSIETVAKMSRDEIFADYEKVLKAITK